MKRAIKILAIIGIAASLPTGAKADWRGDHDTRLAVQGFDGMKPEEIARHLANCSGVASEAAAIALAQHGGAVLPLLKKLLKDTHPMVRRGAVLTLKHMYESDREEFIYAEFPPEVSDLLKEVRSLAGDSSQWVRAAVGQLAISFKLQNEDVFEILYEMARHGDGEVINIARHNITDPVARTKMTILRTEYGHNKPEVTAADYSLFLVTTAHLELMRDAIPLCLDMLTSEKVWNLYGMGSHIMMRNVFMVLGEFADEDPRVLENLYDVLYVSERIPNRIENYYFFHMNTGPRTIVLNIGPPAIPVVERFLKDMNIRERAYERNEKSPAAEWWKKTRNGATHRMHDWLVTLELLHCLHGDRRAKAAAESLARIYVDRHYWHDTERVRIMDYLLKTDASLVPAWQAAARDELKNTMRSYLQKSLDEAKQKDPAPDPELIASVEKEMAGLPASLDACVAALQKATGDKKAGGWEKGSMESAAGKLDELVTVGDVITTAVAKQPMKEDVASLASFVVRREWTDNAPAGPLWKGTKEFARDTLIRWGAAAEPHLNAFIGSHRPVVEARLAELDAELRRREKGNYRYEVNHLARIPLEKYDTREMPVKLEDIVHIIRSAEKAKLSDEDTARLCRIMTRRGWRSQDSNIMALLKKGSKDVVQKHITAEEGDGLAGTIKKKNEFINMTVRSRFRWQYEYYKAIETNIREGLAVLKGAKWGRRL